MSLLLLLATVGTPFAEAAPVKAAGKIELSGVVEVPLYKSLGKDDHRTYVELVVGDKKLFMRVGSDDRKVVLTKAALGKLGLKASGPDGKQKVTVAEATLGGATLKGVKANVVDDLTGGGMAIDGELSLMAFDDLAFAVVPSEGVLRLAPAASGAGLVTAIGPTVPYESHFETVKKKVGGMPMELPAVTIEAPVKWSGAEVSTIIVYQVPEGFGGLAREVEGVTGYSIADSKAQKVTLPAAPGTTVGERTIEWREVSVGGFTAYGRVVRGGLGFAHAYSPNAALGVGGMDFAVDPGTHTLALRSAGSSKIGDYRPTYEAALRAALDAKPAEDGTAPDEEAKKAARKAGLGPLSKYLLARGRYDEAIAARKELADIDPDDCKTWLRLGQAYSEGGRASEAIEPLTKASALYQPWAALPLAERESISKDKDKAEKAKKDWTGQKPQDHACHVAAGALALAQLQSGNAAAVSTLYPAQLDLDAGLPLAAGNASLLQGQFDAAQAAYLQALKLSGMDNTEARVGLYLALAPKDFASARQQLERLFVRDTDTLVVRLYVEGVRKSLGNAAVIPALDTLLAGDPGNAVLLAQRSRERAAAGDAAGAASDWDASKAAFARGIQRFPNNGSAVAAWACALAAAGQVAEAQKAAEEAVALAPESGRAWLAVADAAAAAGDTAKAQEARIKAGKAWASNPAYALLLAR